LGIFLGVLGDMLVERQQKQKQDNMENARRKYLQNFQHGTYQQGKHPTLTSTNQTIPAEPSSFRKFIESFKIYFNICLNQMWVMVFLFAVAIPVILIEKWDFVKGIYWMVITGTTIGLGDETPTQPISKALCIVYIPVAVYSVGRFLGLVATTFLDQRSQKAEEKFLSRALTLSDIDRMDFDNDGGVSREEFLIYMLVTLQKVEQEDVNEIMDVFRKLDKTGDGVLDADDLAAEIKRANEITSGMRSEVS
jgi:Ion channel/EF hand